MPFAKLLVGAAATSRELLGWSQGGMISLSLASSSSSLEVRAATSLKNRSKKCNIRLGTVLADCFLGCFCWPCLAYHSQRFCIAIMYNIVIRPHLFGGEGVLIGVQSATLNAQVTFVYIAVAISALAGGGALKNFAPKPFPCWCFRNFSDVFWGLDLKRVLRWNFGSFWGDFRTGKEEKQEQNSVHRDVLEGFRMSEQEDTFASSPELFLRSWLSGYSPGKQNTAPMPTYIGGPLRALETDVKQLRCGRPPHAKRGELIHVLHIVYIVSISYSCIFMSPVDSFVVQYWHALNNLLETTKRHRFSQSNGKGYSKSPSEFHEPQ